MPANSTLLDEEITLSPEDKDNAKMWHIVRYTNPNVALCGKKITSQMVDMVDDSIDCIVCKEIFKKG